MFFVLFFIMADNLDTQIRVPGENKFIDNVFQYNLHARERFSTREKNVLVHKVFSLSESTLED